MQHAGIDAAVRRRFAFLAGGAALYIYALIVFGGIVRITGSGLGCGDDWPRCNGQWIPFFDLATTIEWTHRLLAALVILPFGALALQAIRHRRLPGFPGRGGVVRPLVLAAALLLVQVVLGAVTVKLDLPAGITAWHFVNALLILAALVAATVRAATYDSPPSGGSPRARSALAAALLGLVVVAFGALTANTGLPAASGQPSASAWACQGFPLCNGSLVPDGGMLVHIQWTHRLLAYALFFHVLAATAVALKGAPPAVARAAAASLGLVIAQVGVAAGLVLLRLPDSLQALHLAVGVAVFVALVAWAALARAAAANAPARAPRALDVEQPA